VRRLPDETRRAPPSHQRNPSAWPNQNVSDLRGETESEMRQQFESIRGRTATNEKLIRNLVPLALAGHCKNND